GRSGPNRPASAGDGDLGTRRGGKTAFGALAWPAGPVHREGTGALRPLPAMPAGREPGARGPPLAGPDPPPQGGRHGQGGGRGAAPAADHAVARGTAEAEPADR